LQNSKDTVVLLATSGEFRDLMTNLSFVVRDMFGSYGKLGEFGAVERYATLFVRLRRKICLTQYE
jgi:hypothetical protein